jgi:hypothetical protein
LHSQGIANQIPSTQARDEVGVVQQQGTVCIERFVDGDRLLASQP